MSKEATKKDLYWICQKVVEQVERRIEEIVSNRYTPQCPLCRYQLGRSGTLAHDPDCVYEAAKLAVKRRK